MRAAKILIIVFLSFFVFAGASFFIFSQFQGGETRIKPEENLEKENPEQELILLPPAAKDLPKASAAKEQEKLSVLPDSVFGIYLTSASAGSNNAINRLVDLASTTEINAAVIDIKDFSGVVRFPSPATIKKLHEEGIYLIARIVVFQDPVLAGGRPDLAVFSSSTSSLWLDKSGLNWIDPAAKEYWEYIAGLAEKADLAGFDEINFDYIRFPSDGDLNDIIYSFWDGVTPRKEIIREFYQYLRERLPGAKLSVDLFGYSTTNFDDLGIGHFLEDAFEYFNYVSPMVYPSHYSPGFQGFENPNEYPYEVISYSMGVALERLKKSGKIAKLRPWLQHFNLGVEYDAGKIKSEIQAVKDALGENYNGFMLWSPTNIYIKEAIGKNE